MIDLTVPPCFKCGSDSITIVTGVPTFMIKHKEPLTLGGIDEVQKETNSD